MAVRDHRSQLARAGSRARSRAGLPQCGVTAAALPHEVLGNDRWVMTRGRARARAAMRSEHRREPSTSLFGFTVRRRPLCTSSAAPCCRWRGPTRPARSRLRRPGTLRFTRLTSPCALLVSLRYLWCSCTYEACRESRGDPGILDEIYLKPRSRSIRGPVTCRRRRASAQTTVPSQPGDAAIFARAATPKKMAKLSGARSMT